MQDLDAHCVLVHNVDRLHQQYGEHFEPKTMTRLIDNYVAIYCRMDEHWQRDQLAIAKEFFL